MKHTFILLLAFTLFSLSFKSYSQEVNITTATIEHAVYIKDTWEQSQPIEKIVSKFIHNKIDSTVTHIIGDGKSVYEITDYEFNQEKNRLELGLVSDSQDFYYGIIDDVNENIRFIREDADTLRLVRYAFKEMK